MLPSAGVNNLCATGDFGKRVKVGGVCLYFDRCITNSLISISFYKVCECTKITLQRVTGRLQCASRHMHNALHGAKIQFQGSGGTKSLQSPTQHLCPTSISLAVHC